MAANGLTDFFKDLFQDPAKGLLKRFKGKDFDALESEIFRKKYGNDSIDGFPPENEVVNPPQYSGTPQLRPFDIPGVGGIPGPTRPSGVEMLPPDVLKSLLGKKFPNRTFTRKSASSYRQA